MNYTEKDVKIFKGISLISGIFTLLVAFTMIFTLIQLKTINPLDSPALLSVKEQFDRTPDSKDKAEQVRAMDLMARKAYFSSRWEVETGSYLMLAGAVIFVLFQRLIAGSEKPARNLYPDKPDIKKEKNKYQRLLIIAAGTVTILAVISSFVLRTNLPSAGRSLSITAGAAPASSPEKSIVPDDVNFPFFRGSGSNGIAAGSGFPIEWDGAANKNIKWKLAIPKQGKNSPVIWGENLFLTGAEGGICEIYCINKNTGKINWTGSGSDFPGSSKEVPESDAEAGMAVPTTAVSDDGVCAIFGNGNLVCYSHDGKFKWGKSIGIPANTYGYASSLLIWNGILIVQFDSDAKISLSGFDMKNGEQKWETIRQGRPVWSSPVLTIFDNQPQILINGNPNVTAYDPATGKELWTLPGVTNDVVPSLAINSKLVFAVTDYAKLVALKPGKSGSKVWEDNTFTPEASSPVATDKYLFVTTGNGDAACYNAEKGDTLWSHYFQNPFYASPIVCDNKVWMLDRNGIMHIVEEGSKLKIISSSPIGEKTDCTPAFSEKKIYIRGKDNLYCIGKN
jgi:outer membrane protein assembly factor BamB